MSILAFLAESAAESSFIRLFTEMNWVAALLFVLGIVFCAIEMFIPGFGFFGITGSVLVIAGIIVRVVCGGDAFMFLYMLLIALVLFFVMFFVASRLITKGKLSKTALFNVKPAVSEEKTEGTQDFSYLVGQAGIAQTPLRPVGKVMFDGHVVDVVARDGFIDEGVRVTVIQTEGTKVVVVEATD